MRWRWIGTALFAGLVVAYVGTASAQQGQPAQPSIMSDEDGSVPQAPSRPAKPARVRGQRSVPAFEHDPDLDAQDQFAPSQIQQTMPEAVPMPSGGRRTHAATRGSEAVMEPGAI